MIYTDFYGCFRSANSNKQYRVDIFKRSAYSSSVIVNEVELQLSGSQPITIKQDTLDDICGLQLSSLTLNVLVTKDLLFELSTDNYTTPVILREMDTNKVIWCGYMSPYVYSQTALPVTALSLNCVSCLNILKYIKFGDSLPSELTENGNVKLNGSVRDLIVSLLEVTHCPFDVTMNDVDIDINRKYYGQVGLNADGDKSTTGIAPLSDVFVTLGGLYETGDTLDGEVTNESDNYYELLESVLESLNLVLTDGVGEGDVFYVYNRGLKNSEISDESTMFADIKNLGSPSFGPDSSTNYKLHGWLQFFSMRSSGTKYYINGFENLTYPNTYDHFKTMISWDKGHYLICGYEGNYGTQSDDQVVVRVETWIPTDSKETDTTYFVDERVMSPTNAETWTLEENLQGLHIQFVITVTDSADNKYQWKGSTDGSLEFVAGPVIEMDNTVTSAFKNVTSYNVYRVNRSGIKTIKDNIVVSKDTYYGSNHTLSYADMFDKIMISYSKKSMSEIETDIKYTSDDYLFTRACSQIRKDDGSSIITQSPVGSKYMSNSNWYQYYKKWGTKDGDYEFFKQSTQRYFNDPKVSDCIFKWYDVLPDGNTTIDYSKFPCFGYSTDKYTFTGRSYSECLDRWKSIYNDMLYSNSSRSQSDVYWNYIAFARVNLATSAHYVPASGRTLDYSKVYNMMPIGVFQTQYTVWDRVLNSPEVGFSWDNLMVYHTGWDYFAYMDNMTFWANSHDTWTAKLYCDFWTSDMLKHNYWKSEGSKMLEYWNIYPYWRAWYRSNFVPKDPVMIWKPKKIVSFKADKDKKQYLLLNLNLLFQSNYNRISDDNNQEIFYRGQTNVSDYAFSGVGCSSPNQAENIELIKAANNNAGGQTIPLTEVGYSMDSNYNLIYNRYWDKNEYNDYLTDETIKGKALSEWYNNYNNGWPLVRIQLRIGDKCWNGEQWVKVSDDDTTTSFDLYFHDKDVYSQSVAQNATSSSLKYLNTESELNETLSCNNWLVLANPSYITNGSEPYTMDKLNIPITTDLSGEITVRLWGIEQPYFGQFQLGDRAGDADYWGSGGEAGRPIGCAHKMDGSAVDAEYTRSKNNVWLSVYNGFNYIFMKDLKLEYVQNNENMWAETYNDDEDTNGLTLVVHNEGAVSGYSGSEKKVSKTFIPRITSNSTDIVNHIYTLWSDGNITGANVIDKYGGVDFNEYIKNGYKSAYGNKKIVYETTQRAYEVSQEEGNEYNPLKLFDCSGILSTSNGTSTVVDRLKCYQNGVTWDVKNENRTVHLVEV